MVNAQVFGLSLVDRNGDFFFDGSEQFSIYVNVKRGDPLWDVLFGAMRDRRAVPLTMPVAGS